MKVYLVVGVPCSGKSWVTSQLMDKFNVLEHDCYKQNARYIEAILRACHLDGRDVLANTPFGMSEIHSAIEGAGFKVVPVFILEPEHVLIRRYEVREGKTIPGGHLTRQRTYQARAHEFSAFKGTSSEVLEHLKNIGM